MTIAELQERQAWTLDQKIDHAVGTIEAFAARVTKKLYVSFSGGKDSTVLLDIARRYINKDMPAVFLDTGNEYPEIVRFVHEADNVITIRPKTTMPKIIAKYGFPLVSKDVSLKIRQLRHSKSQRLIDIRLNGYEGRRRNMAKCPRKWLFLRNVDFDISEKCCDYIKKKPFEEMERQTGYRPLIGVTAAESRLRTMQYIIRGGCNAFTGPRPRSYPISIFTEKDIFEYVHRYHIRLSSLYDDGNVRQSGCMLCGFGADQDPRHFDYLYEHYPKVYNSFMKMKNHGADYRTALHLIGAKLPDEKE